MSDTYRTVTMARLKAPDPRGARARWFGIVCLGLGGVCAWFVVQLSPQKGLVVGGPAAALSQLRHSDAGQFLEGRVFIIVLSLALAMLMFGLVRTPRSQ